MLIVAWLIFAVSIVKNANAGPCGCRVLRSCYIKMVEELTDFNYNEAMCIEDASMGTSALKVYLTALVTYCGQIIKVNSTKRTYHGRSLYEVEVFYVDEQDNSTKPTIIIEAGQEGGHQSVELALYWLQQLVACVENEDMFLKVKWIILPCTNPDGMEYIRHFRKSHWKKNCRPLKDKMSSGVDITRNFASNWQSCGKENNGFSVTYPGSAPNSENETQFIQEVLKRNIENTKIYLSIKGDGHYIGFPHAYSARDPNNKDRYTKVTSEVAARVNQRAGSVQFFLNDTIHALRGKPHCGHSVDYASDLGIPISLEMRVYQGSDNEIMSMFQTLPRGYEDSLRNGYTSGLRELYNVVTNDKKYGNLFAKKNKTMDKLEEARGRWG